MKTIKAYKVPPQAERKSRAELTCECLREVLQYDPNTGQFTWLGRKSNRSRAKFGERAGSMSKGGYWYIKIDGRQYLAHRLAWLYTHGAWPVAEIDHINGVKLDNRLANLREATHAQNGRNHRISRTNTSGVIGVYWHKQTGKWHARIKLDGRNKSLGLFGTIEAASVARISAERKYHGDFASSASRSAP